MSDLILDVAVVKSIGGLRESHHIDCVMLSKTQGEFLLRLIADNDEYLELSDLADALKESLK